MGLKTKQLLKESVDYPNVTIVGDCDEDLVPYIFTYNNEHYLCFGYNADDAIDEVMEWLYDKQIDDIFDLDMIYQMALEECHSSDEYMELEAEMNEIEDELDIKDDWNNYRSLEKEKDRIEDEMDSFEDQFINEYINDNFDAHSSENLYIYNDWNIEEITMDEAKKIISEQK